MNRLLLTIFLMTWTGICTAMTGNLGGFRLAPIFGEHMVVQQKKPVLLYGSADRGDKIEIRFDRQSQMITTGENGQWQTEFSPLPAGGPYALQIWVNGSLKTDWQDILSGEVWLCSGQSNMAFELKNAENGSMAVKNAGDPGLRLFNYRGFIPTDNIEFDRASLDRINQLDYFEGNWQTDTPESAAGFSAIACYFGSELRKRLKVPVGLVQVAVGGAPLEAFTDRKSLERHPALAAEFQNREKNDLIMEWVRQRIARNIEQNNVEGQRHPYDPAYIFESGIAPLGKFAVQGVIWYQGESNAHNADLYKLAFPEFIRSWRTFRNDPDLPFFIAQLSGIDRPGWPLFRDVQRKLAEEIPYTGLVVTSDLGDSLNVHPVRKKEVGERFAYQALKKVYGKRIVCDGPVPEKILIKADRMILHFQTAGKLKTSDGSEVRELEVAGIDSVFREVPVVLSGKKMLIKWPGGNCKAIRYAWKPYTRGNLVNTAGLPASTFLYRLND